MIGVLSLLLMQLLRTMALIWAVGCRIESIRVWGVHRVLFMEVSANHCLITGITSASTREQASIRAASPVLTPEPRTNHE
jgi:hypothetical protein